VRRILLDTGPLVALFAASDSRHDDCVEVWNAIEPPLYTCWPVLTEAAWLLRSHPAAVEGMLESAQSGLFSILDLDKEDAIPIAALMKRFRKLKPQLADAALVHLAQRENIDTVFTLDQRDFRIYRTRSNRVLKLLP
jgi:predicted nucleic acid-binding protein